MKNLILVAAMIIASASAQALAAPKKKSADVSQKQCAELVKECFAYTGTERSDCFHDAYTHQFCRNTALGDLAMKRWSMSPIQNPALESAPALMGPKVVDVDCLNNFDNNWSGELVKGDYSNDSMHRMEGILKSCNRETSDQYMRP